MVSIEGFTAKLGNQLFQLAAAIGLAKKNNDVVYYPNWQYARYFEGDFTNDQFMVKNMSKVYNEPHFHYAPITYVKDMAINGYFQSDKYFGHCGKCIKKMFKLKEVKTDIKIELNSCSIHARRGDYCNLPNHHPLATWENYYKSAIEKMDNWFPTKYYVFSDDIESIKKEFPENKLFEYVSGGDEIIDFYLQTLCRHHIIGNSSYSWWSSFLSEDFSGKTIAPRLWFGPAYANNNTADLYRADWIVL